MTNRHLQRCLAAQDQYIAGLKEEIAMLRNHLNALRQQHRESKELYEQMVETLKLKNESSRTIIGLQVGLIQKFRNDLVRWGLENGCPAGLEPLLADLARVLRGTQP